MELKLHLTIMSMVICHGHTFYIPCMESYDALLDMEKMGVEIRDVNDEFAGAAFRDEKTKLMFAYDYVNRHAVRLRGGANMKPALYKELKRLGVKIYDHVMATSLLNEGGKQGARVIGATGVNVRTGEFYIFKAKATVLTTAVPQGSGYSPQNWRVSMIHIWGS